MATNKRMFSNDIVGSDAFLEMPVSSQALYFHLNMKADDDGFINPKMIMRMVGCAEDDLKILLGKRFVIPFENGVVVVKHWLINNNKIQKDRYKPTLYSDQKEILYLKENRAYTTDINKGKLLMLTDCYQTVNISLPQNRIEENRIEENRIEENRIEENRIGKREKPSLKFIKPSFGEVKEYCEERKNGIDPQRFIDTNEAKGWLVGTTKTPMKDWKAAIRTWEAFQGANKPTNILTTSHSKTLVEKLQARADKNK